VKKSRQVDILITKQSIFDG